MSKFSMDYIIEMRNILVNYFLSDFSGLLKSHFEDNHMWFYGKSVFRVVKDLNLKKPEVIFFLMGENKIFPKWGKMSDFDLKSASEIIIEKCKEIVIDVCPGYEANVEMTEKPVNDGNFKIYIKLRESKLKGSKITNDSKSQVLTYAKVVKKEKEIKSSKITEVPHPSSPSIDRLFKSITPAPTLATNKPEIVDIEPAPRNYLELVQKENEQFRLEIINLKMENKILKDLIDNIINKTKPSTCGGAGEDIDSPKSMTRVSSENLLHNAVEELESCGNWDDMMHPPTPKKGSPVP